MNNTADKEIQKRLNSFKNLSEKERFMELQFCLLTPQSKAEKCWQAVEEISKLKKSNTKKIKNILRTKTRFHNTKAEYIADSRKTWDNIKSELNNKDIKSLRNTLSEKVKGFGLKESSHFLRNIGLSNNQIAILDRHILRNLHALNLIKEQKVKSKKDYFEKEKIFLDYAKSNNLQPDKLDLIWWSKENGKIFK